MTREHGENGGQGPGDDRDIPVGPAPLATGKIGSAGVVTLNRPEALNALNDEMRTLLPPFLEDCAGDPMIYALVLRSVGGRAFCAGGDLKELAGLARPDPEPARASLRREYRQVWQLDRFTKASVSLVDGLCMGSGAGLTMFNTHRVAGKDYRFAMPEVGIGFFPDVGASHFLGRLGGEIGTYLALTGRGIGRADAFRLGLVTHCINGDRFGDIIDALGDAEPIDALLADLHEDPGDGELAAHAAVIAETFAADSVAGIAKRLEDVEGADRNWAKETAQEIAAKSPTSLALALAQMRRGRRLGLYEALRLEYRIARRLITHPDFFEGVRALLIDKDGTPGWSPGDMRQIDPVATEAYFAPLEHGDLDLPIVETPSLAAD